MEETSKIFKALSDETRLRIMALLDEGERCVCDLMAVLGLPQSTVSRHLAYLRNTGWVTGRRCGMWMHYSLLGGLPPFQADLLDLLRRQFRASSRIAQDLDALHVYHQAKERQCG